MNTTCSLQLVRATCQLMFAIAVLCVLTRTCTHMYVRFVHADPGEALRRRGRRGPRKAAAVRQVTEFVRTRPCQARPGLWPEDVAVLQAACQALRSCAGGGRVDAAPGPSRRGTAPSMPVRTEAHPGSAWASGGAAPRPDAQEPVSDPTQVSSSTRAPQRSRQGRRAGQPGGGGRHVALRRVLRQASRPQHRSRPQTAPRGRPSPHRSGTVSAPSSLSLVFRLGPCHGPHPAPGHRPFLSSV